MFIENLSDKLEIPKDVSMGATILRVTGQYGLFIENYKNIIEYTQEIIRIQSRTCKICICGKNLHIEFFNEIGMKVCGRIKSIEFI